MLNFHEFPGLENEIVKLHDNDMMELPNKRLLLLLSRFSMTHTNPGLCAKQPVLAKKNVLRCYRIVNFTITAPHNCAELNPVSVP